MADRQFRINYRRLFENEFTAAFSHRRLIDLNSKGVVERVVAVPLNEFTIFEYAMRRLLDESSNIDGKL